MRRTFRQLAAVRPSQYLEAGAPTGLTGLPTHSSPRAALIYLYSRTLDKLAQFPDSSLYRQSTENLTKHRMSIVSGIEPEGYSAWKETAQKIMSKNPEVFSAEKNVDGNVVSLKGKMTKETHGGNAFVSSPIDQEDPEAEWDGEPQVRGGIEVGSYMKFDAGQTKAGLPEEPKLTSAQIEEMENKIGAGLIEEVIQVAEGELKLVDVLLKHQVWEDLVEKPVEGQWTYFMRDTGTPTTQSPPQK
ncbi:NADH-ubiquinone oxidoreductase-like protein 299 kDa subunit [Amylocarpus encephaloides]|uniref:NADH-ubiquinone oxidoreductase-like protein 299 kDa subunit n=1 Tax=Amylocarpus encephaloides TaxID=45428 RepID=A0A9P7YS46_9HELO|nr:NADH-ubiquinone oxidoreductase-like protein 299 kDa subunit [Amylocarpus encephaloides]